MRVRLLVCMLLVAVICGIRVPGAVSAEWGFGGNVGLAGWFAQWDHELTDFDATSAGLYGPSLFIRTGPIGLGLQYYTGSFDVRFASDDREYRTDRTDIDVILSWRFLSMFHVSGLYKRIDFDWHQVFHVETSIEGFGLGGGVSRMVLDDRLLLYGYAFYMPVLDYNQSISSSGSVSSDAHGYWVEGGAGWYFPAVHLILKGGYRIQRITVDGSANDWAETTQGPRIECSYLF